MNQNESKLTKEVKEEIQSMIRNGFAELMPAEKLDSISNIERMMKEELIKSKADKMSELVLSEVLKQRKIGQTVEQKFPSFDWDKVDKID